jgi:hypothetical protein
METYHDGDLSMGSNQRRSGKSNEEEFGEHICGWGVFKKGTNK